MGCVKLHILDEQYKQTELRISYSKKKLTPIFFVENARKEMLIMFIDPDGRNPLLAPILENPITYVGAACVMAGLTYVYVVGQQAVTPNVSIDFSKAAEQANAAAATVLSAMALPNIQQDHSPEAVAAMESVINAGDIANYSNAAARQEMAVAASLAWNPGYDWQRQKDKQGKRGLDQQQANVSNAINTNLPKPDGAGNVNPQNGSKMAKSAVAIYVVSKLSELAHNLYKTVKREETPKPAPPPPQQQTEIKPKPDNK